MNDMRAAMRRKKLFLLDMDGTLYLGDRVFDHCLDFLRAIRRQGGRYLYLTNNSSKSVDKYVEKMERLHIPAAAEDFFTSTDAACAYLREHYHGRKIYALGFVDGHHMRTKDTVSFIMDSCRKPRRILFGNDRSKPIGIFKFFCCAIFQRSL